MTLKEFRARVGLRQEDVAKKIDVSIIAVSNWELGKNGIARKYKKKLVRLYGCTPQELDEAIKESGKKEEGGVNNVCSSRQTHAGRRL